MTINWNMSSNWHQRVEISGVSIRNAITIRKYGGMRIILIFTFCIHGMNRGFWVSDVNAIGTPEICGEVEQHFDRFCGYNKS